MAFAERLPSTAWATLKYKGTAIADVWFKPADEPFGLTFRLPPGPQLLPDSDRQLTVETLLKAVGVSIDEVDGWRVEDLDDADPRPPLPSSETVLVVHVRMKSSTESAPEPTPVVADVPPEKWQDLEVRWKAVLGLEAGIDALRLGMDSLRMELESSARRGLSVEEKTHALQADVAQWTKAKSRIHHALPKLREFVHRATWATAVPERKRLDEVIRTYIVPRIPFAEIDQVREQIEHLFKDRQVLAAQGNAVNQEGRALQSELQRAFGSLQRNASNRAREKRGGGKGKGKF